MMQAIGLLFGLGSVFLGWLLAKKLWDDRTANKVGWILGVLYYHKIYIQSIFRRYRPITTTSTENKDCKDYYYN